MLDLLSIATDGILSSVAPPGVFAGPVPLQLASLGYLYPVFEPGPLPPPRRRLVGGSGGAGKKREEILNKEREEYSLRIRMILAMINGESYVDEEARTKEYSYRDLDAKVKTLSITSNDVGYDVTVKETLVSANSPNVVIKTPIGITKIKPAVSSSLGTQKTIYNSIVKVKSVDVTKKPKK